MKVLKILERLIPAVLLVTAFVLTVGIARQGHYLNEILVDNSRPGTFDIGRWSIKGNTATFDEVYTSLVNPYPGGNSVKIDGNVTINGRIISPVCCRGYVLKIGSGGNIFSIDIAAGRGLVNLVAGAYLNEDSTPKTPKRYIAGGSRGVTRITLNDREITLNIEKSRNPSREITSWATPLKATADGVRVNGKLDLNGYMEMISKESSGSMETYLRTSKWGGKYVFQFGKPKSSFWTAAEIKSVEGGGSGMIGAISVYGGGKEKVRISGKTSFFLNDKVGIGTSTPAAKLHVAGDTLIDGKTIIRNDLKVDGNIRMDAMDPKLVIHSRELNAGIKFVLTKKCPDTCLALAKYIGPVEVNGDVYSDCGGGEVISEPAKVIPADEEVPTYSYKKEVCGTAPDTVSTKSVTSPEPEISLTTYDIPDFGQKKCNVVPGDNKCGIKVENVAPDYAYLCLCPA